MPTKLILIRHGQTNWNLEKRYSGFIDVSLNKNGKNQAEKLCARLKKINIHKVYSSDRKRASQTAEIAFKQRKVETIADLREVHFGVFEGLTYKEIMRLYPVIYQKWLEDPFGITIPGAESLISFKKRIIKAFKNIMLGNKNKTVAVVSHGGAISIFINSILRKSDFWKYIPDSASISMLEYINSKPGIRLLNDTNHLEQGRTAVRPCCGWF